MPSISVILPTYNREATLGRAIRSVLAQTFSDFELIVVDDASSDGTAQLVRSINDPRLCYLRLPNNRGPAGARNTGIAKASGEWLAFQDSDDEWLPTKLEQQWAVASIANSTVGLVLGGYQAAGAATVTEILPHETLAGRNPLPDVLDGWPIITPTWLVRRNLLQQLEGFDESYPCLEDWDLAFRITDRCEVRAVPGPVLIKHSGVDSVCADPMRLGMALDTILRIYGDRWHGHSGRLTRRLTHLGCVLYRLGRKTEARIRWRRAQAAAPFNVAGYGFYLASFIGPHGLAVARRLWPRYAGMAP